ncbi:hypothetical protein E2320_003139, partial [Naja naja]
GPTPQIRETLDSPTIHGRKKKHGNKSNQESPLQTKEWLAGCGFTHGLQKPGSGAPDRHVTGGRGCIFGQDCKQDTRELAGFKRGVKAVAVAEGGFSFPFVEAQPKKDKMSSAPSFPCFHPSSETWESYINHFDCFVDAADLSEISNHRKKAYFLSFCGAAVFDTATVLLAPQTVKAVFWEDL